MVSRRKEIAPKEDLKRKSLEQRDGEYEFLHASYFFLAESCLDKSLLVCICPCLQEDVVKTLKS